MWMEHDQIRPLKKAVRELVAAYTANNSPELARQILERATELSALLESHFHKENNILFPAGQRVIADDEWAEIMRQFDEIGYPEFSARLRAGAIADAEETYEPPRFFDGVVSLDTGNLSLSQLEGILNILPVEVTFVDADDRVRYFSSQKERLFVRAKAAIGREVQQCHPQKSLHLVMQILEDFRSGARDNAEFWLPLAGRMVHVRFFAVRDRAGAYLGCLEVTQDITDIQKITGQKRLL
jgi:DUF438 domain-containing protein